MKIKNKVRARTSKNKQGFSSSKYLAENQVPIKAQSLSSHPETIYFIPEFLTRIQFRIQSEWNYSTLIFE